MNKRTTPVITHNFVLHSNEHSAENEFPLFNQFDGIPPRIIPFNEAMTSRDYDAFVHFFIDDYQFERVWARPHFYREKLVKFAGLVAPDFSILTGMSHMSLLWNTYRSRVVAAFYAKMGMNVIPCVSWDQNFKKNSFFWEGIEPEKTVAISTNGVFRDKETRECFISGAEEMARQLRPKTILVYGFEIPFNTHGATVIYYNNHFLERLRKYPLTENQLKKNLKNCGNITTLRAHLTSICSNASTSTTP